MVRGMIHVLSIEALGEVSLADTEVAARIAGLKRALRLLEPHGHGPSCDEDQFGAVEFESDAARRCFDARSERVIGAAAAGLEAVVEARGADAEPNRAAIDVVAEAIRAGLADLAELLRR
jgi:hypothetical protein